MIARWISGAGFARSTNSTEKMRPENISDTPKNSSLRLIDSIDLFEAMQHRARSVSMISRAQGTTLSSARNASSYHPSNPKHQTAGMLRRVLTSR